MVGPSPHLNKGAAMMTRDSEELLETLLDNSIPVTESGCWIWLLSTNFGYGQFAWKGKQLRVHRVMYELLRGPIPEGLVPDHLCQVKCCINPWHLEAVTQRENVLRGSGPTSINARLTHCRHGHPLTAENLIKPCLSSGQIRVCRLCNRARQARYRMNKKARRTHAVQG